MGVYGNVGGSDVFVGGHGNVDCRREGVEIVVGVDQISATPNMHIAGVNIERVLCILSMQNSRKNIYNVHFHWRFEPAGIFFFYEFTQ